MNARTRDRRAERTRRARSRTRLLVFLALAGIIVVAAIGSDRTAAGMRGGAGFEGAAPAVMSTPFLLATFNVHSVRSPDNESAWDRAIDTLRGFDFVGLQEVRGELFGPGQAAQFGQDLAMSWCFAPSERRFWHDHFGNAALSRAPVVRWVSVPLVNTRGKAYRNYLQAEIEAGGGTVTIVVTHIDRNEDRLAQLRRVGDVFLALSPPAVLMGDFNSAADEPALRRVLDTPGVVDALAGKADPLTRIDWILTRGLTVVDAGVVDRGASDHPCYWAEVEIGE